jgi:hypothetical protein
MEQGLKAAGAAARSAAAPLLFSLVRRHARL